MQAPESIDSATRTRIFEAVRSALATEWDQRIKEWRFIIENTRSKLESTTPSSCEQLTRAELSCRAAQAHVEEVRDRQASMKALVSAGRMSSRSVDLFNMNHQLKGAVSDLWQRRRDYNRLMNQYRPKIVQQRRELREKLVDATHHLNTARRLRRHELRTRASEMRQRLSEIRCQLVEQRRAAIRDALDHVDQYVKRATGVNQSFVRGTQLPFHLWMKNDPGLVAWQSEFKLCDAFEQIVGIVKTSE